MQTKIIYKLDEASPYCFGPANSTVAGSSLTLVFSSEDVVSSSCSRWVTGYSLLASLYGLTTGPPCQKVTKYCRQQQHLHEETTPSEGEHQRGVEGASHSGLCHIQTKGDASLLWTCIIIYRRLYLVDAYILLLLTFSSVPTVSLVGTNILVSDYICRRLYFVAAWAAFRSP